MNCVLHVEVSLVQLICGVIIVHLCLQASGLAWQPTLMNCKDSARQRGREGESLPLLFSLVMTIPFPFLNICLCLVRLNNHA